MAIAAHLEGTLRELHALAALRPARPYLIFDVASVKQCVADAAVGIANLVASHPMAGGEKAGPENASTTLFRGRTWAYVPTENARAIEALRAFVLSLGATPLAIGAPEHDRAVALTSHLPQLMATCFSARLRESGTAHADALLGPAGSELRRLGASKFCMWRDILGANAPNLGTELREFAAAMERAAAWIEAEDFAAFEERFAVARGTEASSAAG